MSYQQPTNYNKHFDVIVSPFATADSDGMGIITVDSDQPTQARSVTLINGVWIKARSTNAGIGYVGFDSGVSSDTGYELPAGTEIRVQVQDLSSLWFTATVGDQFNWLKA